MAALEIVTYYSYVALAVLFMLYAGVSMDTKRYWDLGVGGRLGWNALMGAVTDLAPYFAISSASFGSRHGYLWAVLIFGIVAFLPLLFLKKTGPNLTTQPLAGDAAEKLPGTLIVDGSDPVQLVRWLEAKNAKDGKRCVVIPNAFADGASPAEILALAARQKVDIKSVGLMFGMMALWLAPLLVLLQPTEWAHKHSRPGIAVLAGIAMLAMEIYLYHWAMRYQDRRRDREAVAITKDPEAYIQAITRAARVLTWTPKYPFLFKRDSIETRAALLRAAAKSAPAVHS